jgi:hypothetical protein
MVLITLEDIERIEAEFQATWCPRCRGRCTGWDKASPEKRECFDCGEHYTVKLPPSRRARKGERHG